MLRSRRFRGALGLFVAVALIAGAGRGLWLWGQVQPPLSPILSMARDWSILEAIVADAAFEGAATSCFAVGPCFGRMAGDDRGPVRAYGGRCVFGSPFAPPLSLAFFYQNASLPVDVATDRFVFEELTDNHSLVNANLVVWDPECYEFLRHVLERRPPRLLDLLARGFEVEKIVVLPDTALLAAPDQKVMSFKFVGPTSGQLLRVRALRTGPATFGPLTFE